MTKILNIHGFYGLILALIRDPQAIYIKKVINPYLEILKNFVRLSGAPLTKT